MICVIFFDLRSGSTVGSTEDRKSMERGAISIPPEFFRIREPRCEKVPLLGLR